MGKRILALALILVANASTAWGQTPALSAEDAEGIEELSRRSPAPRFWLSAEYLLWWIKDANFPPLVTTGAASDPVPGALGSFSTKVLYGGPGIDYQTRNGTRLTAGWWLDDERQWGVEGGYFFIAGRAAAQSFTSPGNPVLARPFFDVVNLNQNASLVAFPGILQGTVAVDAPSFLDSAEINLTGVGWQSDHLRVQGLAGFRYVHLDEGLHINESSLVGLAPQYQGLGIPFDGNTITVADSFDTHNHFYGGQVGAQAEFKNGRWSLNVVVKVALGVSDEVVSIHGSTSINTQPATVANGGLLALASNSGQYTKDVFAVVPEVGVTLGVQITNRIRVLAGYSFLYWSSVARPGDQVDLNVNSNQVPPISNGGAGPVRPAFVFHSTDFLAHGANIGLELRY